MGKRHEPLEVIHRGTSERLVLSGDTHGDVGRTVEQLAAVLRADADLMVVLGDFGYWEHTGQGVKDLRSIDRAAKRMGVTVAFIDGNHDNHPLLWSTYCGPGAVRDDDGFVVVRDSIRYIERGHRWTWGESEFLGLGGAPSADKQWRLELEQGIGFDEYNRRRRPRGEGTLWWPTEELREEDVERAGTDAADVVLTHDAPAGVPVPARKAGDGDAHRELVRSVLDATGARDNFHGHWHVRHDTALNDGALMVHGLGDNRTPLAAALVVLEV